jgi:hypothetical protein
VQVFPEHLRSTVVVHSAVIVVPAVHGVQGLHEADECDVASCHVDPASQIGHVRSAVVVQASNLVPIPQVVVHPEHPVPSTKVWKPSAHVAEEHVVEAAPSQAVQDSSTTPVTAFIIAAHDVQARLIDPEHAVDSYCDPEQAEAQLIQTRFVVGVQAVDSYSVSEQAEEHSEHPLLVKVWKPSAHVAAEHVVEALPVQAVHDPSTTPVAASIIPAHDVQTRFVVGVQAVDSYSVEEQAEAH